jgi:DNA-binding response OmpR family regulator
MPHRILVVEDDLPILELMDLLIRKLGHEPVLVTNGLDALDMIRDNTPALVLLDIMMMPINGWEFLEKLRGELGLVDIPVIIFSAAPGVEERMALLNDKNLGILHKPITFAELREALNRYLP